MPMSQSFPLGIYPLPATEQPVKEVIVSKKALDAIKEYSDARPGVNVYPVVNERIEKAILDTLDECRKAETS